MNYEKRDRLFLSLLNAFGRPEADTSLLRGLSTRIPVSCRWHSRGAKQKGEFSNGLLPVPETCHYL